MTIAISPATLPGGAVGGAYSQALTASGGTGPYTFAVTSGALPSGLSLNTSTGVISGTLGAAGTYSFTIQATDSLSATGSQAYSATITTITIAPTSLPNGANNSAYSQTLTASNGTAPYTFSVLSGALPGGLTIDASTGIISGTPTVIGPFSFTIRATDVTGAHGDQAYALTLTGSIYWFICTSAPRVPAIPVATGSQAEFNRRIAHAFAALAKTKSEVGHLIARPTADTFDGHVLCDGSAVGRTDFPQLFAAIGTQWGVGDGATTFNIPNLVTSPLPVATTAPTQSITSTTVSSSTTTVSTPSGDGETGGTTGGNVSSGGRAAVGTSLP